MRGSAILGVPHPPIRKTKAQLTRSNSSEISAEFLLNNNLQMGALGATGKVLKPRKQMKIDQHEQVRVN
jgi:hypothetical protein